MKIQKYQYRRKDTVETEQADTRDNTGIDASKICRLTNT